MSKSEAAARIKIIQEAINRFLDDNDLFLSDQKTSKVIDWLTLHFKGEASISTSKVHDYLQEKFDFEEYNLALLQNADRPESAEESITALLLATDVKRKKTHMIKWLILFLLIIGEIIFLQQRTQNTHITPDQAKELKTLVAEIVATEKENNNKTSHVAIWNVIKKLDKVTAYGNTSSYKDFNHAQHRVAKQYLIEWLGKARNAETSEHKGVIYNLKSSDITVVDGDTFKTKDNRFRLWGVDAFEKKQTCLDQFKAPYPCGKIADQVLYNIISTASKIECLETTKDRYKRSVVRCKIDGVELGEMLVKTGYMFDYTKYSGGHFKEVENEAKAANFGAWAGCFIIPWDYRHKENLNVCD